MTYDIGIRTVERRYTLVAKGSSSLQKLPEKIKKLLDKVYASLEKASIAETGQNIVRYNGGPNDIEVGVEVLEPVEVPGSVFSSTLPGGRVAIATHTGPYSGLNAAHVAINDWCRVNGEVPSGVFWEVYGHWNDDESKLETEVFYLLKP